MTGRKRTPHDISKQSNLKNRERIMIVLLGYEIIALGRLLLREVDLDIDAVR